MIVSLYQYKCAAIYILSRVCTQTCASIYVIQMDPIQTEHMEYIMLGT